MAPKVSKKSQADLISLVKSAGWKEDSKTGGDKHIRWWHPRDPETYYSLRDAAALVAAHKNGVAKRELAAKLDVNHFAAGRSAGAMKNYRHHAE